MTGSIVITIFAITAVFTDITSGFLIPCKNLFPCGRPSVQPNNQRIVGGQQAQRGAWPWTVLLVRDGYVVCGGAIISEQLILTATHCFSGKSNETSRWKVVAGKTRLDMYEHSQQSVRVNRIILHENFNSTTLENDIAMMVLSDSLSFSSLIQPICVPDSHQGVTVGQMCLMAGWGETKGTGDQKMLNQVEVPIIADDLCSNPDWYGAEFHGEKTFCAGYEEGGKDACHGDSGGPLICKDGDRWLVQGIASWGIECGIFRWPGIYTEVSKFSSWIQTQINAENKGNCD